MSLPLAEFITEKSPVLMVGPTGTGKSHLANALSHCAIRQGIDVIYLSQNKLLNELQMAKASGRYQRKFTELVKVPLLIIDDFGLRPLRSPQDEDFHDLISERYEKTATMVTSNLDFHEWGDAFPNRLLAAATIDRLRHNAHCVILDGPSYRGLNNNEVSLANKKRSGKVNLK